jgi:hypothetical protein
MRPEYMLSNAFLAALAPHDGRTFKELHRVARDAGHTTRERYAHVTPAEVASFLIACGGTAGPSDTVAHVAGYRAMIAPTGGRRGAACVTASARRPSFDCALLRPARPDSRNASF